MPGHLLEAQSYVGGLGLNYIDETALTSIENMVSPESEHRQPNGSTPPVNLFDILTI